VSVAAPGWALHRGLVDLDGPHPAGSPMQTAHRYAWAYDERELGVLADVFNEDAVFEAIVADGEPIEPLRGRAAVVTWLKGHMAAQHDQRRHNMLNPVVLVEEPNEAVVCAYLLLTAAEDGLVRLVTTGTYRLRMTRTAEAPWRIAQITAGFDRPF
jgi:hypothetical protein